MVVNDKDLNQILLINKYLTYCIINKQCQKNTSLVRRYLNAKIFDMLKKIK
jgi:hypothetical protein